MLLGDFLLQQHEQYWRHWPRSNSNIYMLLKQDNTRARIYTHTISLSLYCVGPRNWCCSTSRPASLYHHKPFCAATPSPREGPSLSITHSHPRQHDQALPESERVTPLLPLSLSLSRAWGIPGLHLKHRREEDAWVRTYTQQLDVMLSVCSKIFQCLLTVFASNPFACNKKWQCYICVQDLAMYN